MRKNNRRLLSFKTDCYLKTLLVSLSLLSLGQLGAWGQNTLSPTSSIHSMFLAFSHDAIPISFLSCSTVLRHVVLGLPRLRFPSGCHVRAVLQWLFLSIRSTCRIHFPRLLLSSTLTRLVSVLFSRSLLEITYGHHLLSWWEKCYVVGEVKIF